MKAEIVKFIESELLGHQQTIDTHQDLLISGLVDSIGVMRLVGFIERTHEIHVSPKDITLENFGSVETIETFIQSSFN